MFFKRNKEERNILNEVHPKYLYDGCSYIYDGIPIYVKNQKVYKFTSNRAYWSWYLDSVIVDSLPELESGGTLGFRDGTLIQNAKDGRIYLISNARRRLLTAPLGDYGFDFSEVIEVSDTEIDFHTEGDPLG
jgi:hypothetical protein